MNPFVRLPLVKMAGTLAFTAFAILSMAQSHIRIMSFNIQQPYGTSWEARRDSAVKLIMMEQPDIVGTQEAVNYQRTYLLENIKDYQWFGGGRDGGDNGEGCWIFYTNRFTIDSARSGNFWLSATPLVPSRFDGDYNRMCTYVWLTEKSSGKGFYVFNVHFPVPELDAARLTSMQFVAGEIARIAANNEPVLLTGDFNSPEDDAATIWMKSAADNPVKVTDSYRQVHPKAYITTGFGTRYDYIYYRNTGHFKCNASRAVPTPAGASDHLPIEADFLFYPKGDAKVQPSGGLNKPAQNQIKLIFDTDFGGDADDLGALAMLNHFIDRQECDLLAVMCWSTEKYAVSAIDAVNHFYSHPDIPIGARKDTIYTEVWNYTKPIADAFPHKANHHSVPDATILYRQILAKADDASVTIVAVGPLKNLQNLILSVADTVSTLTGKELINRKVKEFVIMGGQFPSGKNEWNFNGNMPGVTRYVIENIEVPVTFSGFEVGNAVKTGEVFNQINRHSPLYIGFYHFSQHAPWIKSQFKGSVLLNSTFDQTAVLYAVRNGVGVYWEKSDKGRCLPDENGGNTWVNDKNAKHTYLKLKMSAGELAQKIDSIMLNDF